MKSGRFKELKKMKYIYKFIKKRFFKLLLWCSLLIAVFVTIVNLIIINKAQEFIYTDTNDVPEAYTALVLGALVSKSGYLSNFLQDRMDVAIELYKKKKIRRFLLSGDHGRKNYDEVNSMKFYLTERGINTKDIFLDHAGFDTYSSMVRARDVFSVNDVIIISQKFHLSRAVYIARQKGLKAYGVVADRRSYGSIKRLKIREIIANIKAYFEVLINKSPRFLGKKIPIYGDSKLSYD